MDQDRKRLKREYARLVSKLERVLRRYAPIDPSDEDSIGTIMRRWRLRRIDANARCAARRTVSSDRVPSCESLDKGATTNPQLDWKITDAVQKAFLSKEKERTRPPAQSKPLFSLIFAKIGLKYLITSRNKCGFSYRMLKLTSGRKLVSHIEFGFECSQAAG